MQLRVGMRVGQLQPGHRRLLAGLCCVEVHRAAIPVAQGLGIGRSGAGQPHATWHQVPARYPARKGQARGHGEGPQRGVARHLAQRVELADDAVALQAVHAAQLRANQALQALEHGQAILEFVAADQGVAQSAHVGRSHLLRDAQGGVRVLADVGGTPQRQAQPGGRHPAHRAFGVLLGRVGQAQRLQHGAVVAVERAHVVGDQTRVAGGKAQGCCSGRHRCMLVQPVRRGTCCQSGGGGGQ